MSTSTASVVNVALTLRDLQWLVMTDVLTSTLLNVHASDDAMDMNADAAERLYFVHYSQEEQDALRARLRALLPPETPLVFASPQFPASTSALPS
jgi:hypothetical protein